VALPVIRHDDGRNRAHAIRQQCHSSSASSTVGRFEELGWPLAAAGAPKLQVGCSAAASGCVAAVEEVEEEEEDEAEAPGPAICSMTIFGCSGEPSESVTQSAASSTLVAVGAGEEVSGAGLLKLATCELLREGVGWAMGTTAAAVTAGTGMLPFTGGWVDSVGAGIAVEGDRELDGPDTVGVGCAPRGLRGNNRHPSGKVIGTAVSEPFPVIKIAWFVWLRFAPVPPRMAWRLFKLMACSCCWASLALSSSACRWRISPTRYWATFSCWISWWSMVSMALSWVWMAAERT
jgi:hypothetical protein